MKAIPLVLFSLLMAAPANANDEIRCWFDGCKVRIREEHASPSVDERKVNLTVDCNKGFELEDERATRIDRRDEDIIVGTDRGDLAVVTIKDKHGDANDGREQRATLVISSDRGNFCARIEGTCKK